MAVIENPGSAFEPVDYDADVLNAPMTFDLPITLLEVHQHRVHRVGKRPGRAGTFIWAPEEVFRVVQHKLDRVEARLRRDGAIAPGSGRRDLERGMKVVRSKGR